MKPTDRDITVKVDAYTRICLSIIAVLLTVLIAGLWAEGWPDRSATAAKPTKIEPFTGTAAQGQITVSKQISAKLDRLMNLLQSGKVKVTIQEAPTSPAGGRTIGGSRAAPKPK